MAQYFLAATDADPLSRLTARFGASLSVVDDVGTTAIKLTKTDNTNIEIASLDDAGQPQDVEVVARGRSTDTGANQSFGAVGRFDASQNGYGGQDIENNDLIITRYDTGTRNGLASAFVVIADTTAYHWVRFRINGSTLKARSWDGTPADEPGTWDIETTDSTHSSGGHAGFGSWRFDVFLTDLGIGTAGDSAPTSDPGGGTTYSPYWGVRTTSIIGAR